ncbi:protein MKS1-like [Solanum verrucosum]|nr:protein MKS1-like [Solanum verrucosum]
MPFSSFSTSTKFASPYSFDSQMDQPENSAGKSPRRELQGPRPAPLKVRKDSHKIRKPPVPPSQQHHHHHQQPLAPPRPPVIIYTVSPKVIHANPSEFMTLVQRLTGSNHHSTACSSTETATSSFYPFQENMNTGAISPAARFASIEKTRVPEGKKLQKNCENIENYNYMVHEGIEIGTEIERGGFFPGILSPNPSSLPPIPPNFFSPPSNDPNPLGFFYDLVSPVLHSNNNNNNVNNKNYFELPNFLPSPSNNNFISPRLFLSPGTPSFDLFNNLFDI